MRSSRPKLLVAAGLGQGLGIGPPQRPGLRHRPALRADVRQQCDDPLDQRRRLGGAVQVLLTRERQPRAPQLPGLLQAGQEGHQDARAATPHRHTSRSRPTCRSTSKSRSWASTGASRRTATAVTRQYQSTAPPHRNGGRPGPGSPRTRDLPVTAWAGRCSRKQSGDRDDLLVAARACEQLHTDHVDDAEPALLPFNERLTPCQPASRSCAGTRPMPTCRRRSTARGRSRAQLVQIAVPSAAPGGQRLLRVRGSTRSRRSAKSTASRFVRRP